MNQIKIADIVKDPKKLSPVFDWRKAYKFWTVQLSALMGLVNLLSDQIGSILPFLPGDGLKWFNGVMAILIIATRLTKQFEPIAVGTETKTTVETTEVAIEKRDMPTDADAPKL